MEVTSSPTQLGCGRDIDDVWDNINDPPTRHELVCPYCQAARSDLADLVKVTRAYHHQDSTDPDLEANPAVIDRILAIAHAEVRRGRRLPLDRPATGQASDLTVSEQTVAAVIRRIGDRGGSIQIRRCSVELDTDHDHDHTATATTTATATATANDDALRGASVGVRVSLRVSVDKAAPIVTLINELRQTIIAVVAREVGLDVTNVDVTVEDVHDA